MRMRMGYRRYPTWMRRVSCGLVLPMVLLCTDFHKAAWAFRVEHARRQKLLDVAKKQGIDPEVLLDPIGYQKKETDRAKVRRAKALKEAAELSKPDPVKLAAAERERAQVRRAYAPVELASIAKDVEGLRATLPGHRRAGGEYRRTQSALRSIDGYARILSDASEVLERYDATEREKLAGLPAVIRARHERFMRAAKPLVQVLRDHLNELVQTDAPRRASAIVRVEADLARIAPPRARPAHHEVPVHYAKLLASLPRTSPEELLKVAPRVMTPQKFDEIERMMRMPPVGGVRGVFKVPGFLLALLQGPGAGDLVSTDEAPKDDPTIAARAAALGNDPIRIFNFVHDSVVTEVYYGSKKGARGTLAEMAGKDVDPGAPPVAPLRG